jgi:hypothetical protein
MAEVTTRPRALLSREVRLPSPRGRGDLQALLCDRRSRRAYLREPLELDELSQVLWSAQGTTSNTGTPVASAGGLYLSAQRACERASAGLPTSSPPRRASVKRDCGSGCADHQQDCATTAT